MKKSIEKILKEIKGLLFKFLTLIFLLITSFTQAQELPVEVSILSSKVPNVGIGINDTLYLKIKNVSNSKLDLYGSFTILDSEASNALNTWQWSGVLRVDEVQKIVLKDPKIYGVFYLKYSLTDGRDNKIIDSLRFGRMVYNEQPGDHPYNRLGLAGLNRHGELENGIKTAKALGMTYCRLGIGWNRVEPSKGIWVFNNYDNYINKLVENDIKPQVILTYTTRWASPAHHRNKGTENWGVWATYPPVNFEDWRNYVRKVGERYNGKVFHWEIWNEADWGYFKGTPEEYIRLLKTAYRELKTINQKNIVLSSGFASADPYGGIEGSPDLQARVLIETSDFFDYHAMHQHGSFGMFTSRIDGKLIPFREKHRITKPLFFNETSESSVLGNEYQSETIIKKVIYSFSTGSKDYILFSYLDPHDKPYGIVEKETLFPKQALISYAFLTNQLQGSVFDRKLIFGQNHYAFSFKKNEKTIVPFWNEDPLKGRTSYLIRTTKGNIFLYDIYGNTTKELKSSDYIPVDIASIPSYLVFSSGDSLEILGPVAEQLNSLYHIPGKSLVTQIRLSNPTEKKRKIIFEWSDSESGDKTPQFVYLKAGESKIVKKSFSDFNEKTDKIWFDWKLDDSNTNGRLIMPIKKNVKLISSEESINSDFSAADASQVFNIAEADPTRNFLNWKGSQDISFRLWLSAPKNTLKIRVLLRDDNRVKKAVSEMLWKGESMQICLDFPNQPGNWEFTFGNDKEGKPSMQINQAVAGYNTNNIYSKISYIEKEASDNLYEINIFIPLEAVGVSEEDLENGFRFNALVNDDDGNGNGRNGYIRIADGLGGKKNTELFPLIILDK